MQVVYVLLRTLMMLMNILSWVIVANALLSWFMDPSHVIRRLLSAITEPVIAPFRLLTNRFSGGLPIDLAPLFAILALNLLRSLCSMGLSRLIAYF